MRAPRDDDAVRLAGCWPRVIAAGVAVVDGGSPLDDHRLEHDEINVLAEGRIDALINGAAQVLGPGFAYAYRAGDRAAGRIAPGSRVVCRWVKFALGGAARASAGDGADGDALVLPRRTPLAPEDQQAFADAFARVLAGHAADDAAGRVGAGAALGECVAVIVAAGARAARPVREPRLARALADLERRLAEPLRLRDLAAAIGWSEDHFARRFRREVGVPPLRYLIGLRLAAARRLLIEDQRLAIGEAAKRCGFDDADHFARLFRRKFGVTPSGFRSRLQR